MAPLEQALRILIVDDEPQVREVLRVYLAKAGYDVVQAADGEDAIRLAEREVPDLVILDLMLPRRDGWTVFQKLRSRRDVPVVMLTARGEEGDRLLGLDLGADDYIVKPFSPREVVARVRNVLRRRERAAPEPDPIPLVFPGLAIFPAERRVEGARGPAELTQKEFDLLLYLASHPGRVFTRAQLLESVWGYASHGDASTVTVHVRRIREKIEANPSEPRFVQTVWGVGYRFERDPG
ncbi:MAG TPA: response regulator transcription factor [Anaerolineales bacterium]|nr:response regulator transcription factor [Anaerolineales bacterium]